MKVSDDPGLTRDALKGFYMFLVAEQARHQQDIDVIEDRLSEVLIRCQLTDKEIRTLKTEALRYISF